MIDRREIVKYCEANNIYGYSFSNLRKASREANTIEEAISILTASEEKKPVDNSFTTPVIIGIVLMLLFVGLIVWRLTQI